jgi:hypothetical protein
MKKNFLMVLHVDRRKQMLLYKVIQLTGIGILACLALLIAVFAIIFAVFTGRMADFEDKFSDM